MTSHHGYSSDSSSLDGSRPRARYLTFKRFVDVVGACVLFVVLSPVMLTLAIIIRLQDGGPALFRQVRAGKDGAPFVLLKFRSMVHDPTQATVPDHVWEWEDGVPDDFVFKSSTNARATKIGGFIRKTSLDELPQLINIIRGEMSFIGPRPEQMQIVDKYSAKQRRRLEVRPGLTGLAQVSGRSNIPHGEKIAHDLSYVARRSLRLDALILWRTITTVFKQHGAY